MHNLAPDGQWGAECIYGTAGMSSISARLCILLALLLWANQTSAVDRGETVPDFTLPLFATQSASTSISGNANTSQFSLISLSDYRGRVVLLDFWQTSCAPCRESVPFLRKLNQDFDAAEVAVISINSDPSPRDAMEFIETHSITYTVASDPVGHVAQLYELNGLPTAMVIARDGTLEQIYEGFQRDDWQRISAQLHETSTAEVLVTTTRR